LSNCQKQEPCEKIKHKCIINSKAIENGHE
jgi:hypothetical protein